MIRYGPGTGGGGNCYKVCFWNSITMLSEREIEPATIADSIESFFETTGTIIEGAIYGFFALLFPKPFGTEFFRPIWKVNRKKSLTWMICCVVWNKYMISLRRTFSW